METGNGPMTHPPCPNCATLQTRIAELEALSSSGNDRVFVMPGQKRDKIVAEICMVFEIGLNNLYLGKRTAQYSRARFAACWVLQQAFGWKNEVLARALKLKCRSSAKHGLKRANALRVSDREFLLITDALVLRHSTVSGERI